MSVKQNLTKAFNVALIVASFGLVGAITAGVFSPAGQTASTAEKAPAPALKP